ncbi:MAG TPA: acetolactate synthase large subunit, partial [bacterium]|nr:acetolactate synthase large subunit [bacterium]
QAFGVAAVDLEGQADPASALSAVLQSPGPGLIRVPISDQAKVWPMVEPGGSNKAMLLGDGVRS